MNEKTYTSQWDSPLVDLVLQLFHICGISCTVQQIVPVVNARPIALVISHNISS